MDLLGTGLFGLTIISLLVPLTEGQSLGWPLWTWLVLAVAPLAAAATYRAERSNAFGRMRMTRRRVHLASAFGGEAAPTTISAPPSQTSFSGNLN